MLQKWTTKILNDTITICTIHHLFAWKKFIATPQEIDKYLPIQLKAGQI
jgi:hypothetical protein